MTYGRIVAGLLIMELLAAVDTTGVTVMAPTLQKYFGLSEGFTGWILMSYLLPFAFSLVPMGILADAKKSPEKILRWSTLGFCIASGLCALSTGGYSLVFARILKGICAGGMFATEFAVILKYWKDPRRTVELAVTGLGLGVIVGPLIGGFFSDVGTWRYFFLIGSGLAVLSFYLFKDIEKLEPVSVELMEQESSRWWSKDLSWGLVFEFVVAFATQGFNLFLALHVQNKLNLSPMVSGVLLTIIAVGIFTSNAAGIGSRLFSDVRQGAWTSATVFALCMAGLIILPSLVGIFAYPIYFLMGISLGIVLSTAELMVLESAPLSKIAMVNGMAIAMMQAGYGLASGIMPMIYSSIGLGSLPALSAVFGVFLIARYFLYSNIKST